MADVFFYVRNSFGDKDAQRADELGCTLMRAGEYVSGPFVLVAEVPNGYKVAVDVGPRLVTHFSSPSLDECIGYAKRLSETLAQPNCT